MKQSIISKILIILSIVIITISVSTTLLIQSNEKELIEKIRTYNLEQSFETLDKRQSLELEADKNEIKNTLKQISKNAYLFLYVEDLDGMKNNIMLDMKRDGVKAIDIFDDVMGESFLVAVNENNKINFSITVSKNLDKYIKFTHPIYSDTKEKIGLTTLYYDESIIINKISKIREQTKSKINKFNIIIDGELKELTTLQFYISIISLIVILIVIFILLIKLVNQPLNILKNGLDNFFLFLQNKQDNTNQIFIESNDEFGQMAKSLNENIIVSTKLHEEIYELNINLESRIEERTKDLESSKKETEALYKHTREAIEYAALIQSAVLPDNNNMRKYFKDQFTIWHPKDTVGGDIYFFEELRHKDECLLFFIDCTGHGVPGAFVTMLVKAVEQQIIAEIMNDETNMEISPAWIMAYFNRELKKLLKQEDKSSISNAGWDGGVIYYNKKDQIIKFAGAETPLFYTTKDGELKTIKGNRYSVGYKKCAMDYVYKETILEVEEGMKFYCTTDGYLDQNGGSKDFPFGKKRFGNIIKEYHTESMADQQEMFLYSMEEYETMIPNNDRNDDMTVIAFEIGAKSDFVEDTIEEIVKYEGVITQNVLGSCMDNIEAKITDMNILSTVSTITIEYCQNMMNYSKNDDINSRQIVPAGTIEVQHHTNEDNEYYKIIATNIVSIEDKEKIEPKLIEIQSLDKAQIKKRYRDLRKSGQNTHEKGGGIGMYEIAKVSDFIEYEFISINEDKFTFTMRSFIKTKVRQIT